MCVNVFCFQSFSGKLKECAYEFLLTENCTLCVCFYGRLLIDLYLLAIDAVMKGVETFSKTSDWQKVKVNNNCGNKGLDYLKVKTKRDFLLVLTY